MFLRIYYNGKVKDVPLNDLHEFSIGSSTNCSLNIDSADLKDMHINFIKHEGKWKAICKGSVYYMGKIVDEIELFPSLLLVLSRLNKISVFVIDDYSESETIDLCKISEVKIGRADDNDIVLKCNLVSSHHAVIKKDGGKIWIQDKNSTNGTYVNENLAKNVIFDAYDTLLIGDCKIMFKGDKLYIYGPVKSINLLSDGSAAGGKVMFKRSPRLMLDVPTGEIEIQSPPNIGTKPDVNWVSVILPSLGTVGVSLIVTLITGMNPMMLAFSAPMSIIGVIVSIINYRNQTKKYEEQQSLRIEKYTEHLDTVTRLIESKQDEQRTALVSLNPDVSECFRIVQCIDRRLWERRPTDKDFMSVRVGFGDLSFSMAIKAPQRALSLVEDSLLDRAIEIPEKYRVLKEIPITCSLLKSSLWGIVGNRESSYNLVNNILVQLSTCHCYTEVKTVFIIAETDSNKFDWAFDLPHCYDDERQGHYIAKNKSEVENLFKEFENLAKERIKENEDNSYEEVLHIPYYLFIITSSKLLKGETFSKYLYKNSAEIGIGAIFVCDSIQFLPKECNVIIETDNKKGFLYRKDNASNKKEFNFDAGSDGERRSFGEAIKNIFCDDLNTEATIVKSITLYEVLNVRSADELNFRDRWNSSNVIKSLSAPLGVKEKNEIVYLDIHEFAHGPNGLVAGTVGSGKSEVLQAYILSIATLYHPYEVGFVLIDFKGGGMANQFEELPHLIGAITDIDGKEINRSLMSIRAEIDKRKRLFAENKVNSINKYIELYKANKIKIPIPHLIIIVDEFAELKANQPEFMDELISTARVGRSLGLHLILATQKPAGQVNDQIWANSKFQLCLKVLDRSDSQEVIKSPLAAKIKEPGRAYLRVGNDEIFELFQSGYSGAKVILPDGTESNQLKEIIRCVKKYCHDNGVKPLNPICLPPLPKVIDFIEENSLTNVSGAKVSVGIYDDPAAQMQGPSFVNLNQNTFIFGTTQTGKTNLLQVIVRMISSLHTPKEISLYIVDFASMTLRNFDGLNHVGGVVIREEDEKLKNLFILLVSEIEQRKRKTIEKGVSSFNAYLEAGFNDMPRTVMLIDDLTAFKEMYWDEYGNVFMQICKEGPTYGISVIATSTQTSGYNYMLLSLFADKFAFTCNDPSEYSSLFNGCRMQPSNLPGRALYKANDTVLEMQCYLAFKGEKEVERSNSMRSYVEKCNAKNKGLYAKKIPSVPKKLTKSYICENYELEKKECEYIIGLNYADVSLATINFNLVNELAIVGRSAERKQRVIGTLFNVINDNIIDEPVKMYIVDSVGRRLKSYAKLSFVEKYTIDYNEMYDIVDEIGTMIEKRYNLLVSDKVAELRSLPLVLVVINNNYAVEFMSSTKEIMDKYHKMSKQMKALKIAFIYSDIENNNVLYGSPEMLKRLKDAKNAVLTDDLKETRFFEITTGVARSQKKLKPGDVFIFADTEIKRIKLIEEE